MLENRQDEEKQNKITQMKMRPPTNNWTSLLCGNRNGHHSTEFRT